MCVWGGGGAAALWGSHLWVQRQRGLSHVTAHRLFPGSRRLCDCSLSASAGWEKGTKGREKGTEE